MNLRLYLACTLCAFALLTACGDDEPSSDDDNGSGAGGATTSASGGGGSGGDAAGGSGGMMVPFEVTSSAFEEGGAIPLAQECGPPLMGPGMNTSPPLSWTAGPAETGSYAVVVRDIDAMVPPDYPEGIVHWVIYDIPADVLQLPEGIAANYEAAAPAGAKQANIQNSGFFGYFGMCSPNSINTYQFTVHAMPEATVPGVTMNSTEQEIAVTIESTSIAQASISGES